MSCSDQSGWRRGQLFLDLLLVGAFLQAYGIATMRMRKLLYWP